MEALGNGISSSPSNSKSYKELEFPEFSIRDMVNLQYKLVTEKLKINHLHAVIGISMGGMQTYQWMASYPDFFDKAIPIVGSPELSLYDALNYEIFKTILKHGIADRDDFTFLMLEYTLGVTPRFYEGQEESREAFLKTIKQESSQFDTRDLYSQMLAISKYNLKSALHSHGANSLAEVFKGEALIIYSSTDNLVSSSSNINAIQDMKAQSLDSKSDCGHYTFNCDRAIINERVRNFL